MIADQNCVFNEFISILNLLKSKNRVRYKKNHTLFWGSTLEPKPKKCLLLPVGNTLEIQENIYLTISKIIFIKTMYNSNVEYFDI